MRLTTVAAALVAGAVAVPPLTAEEPAPAVATDLFLDAARTYALRARWDDAERLLERGLAKAVEAKDVRRETRLKIQLGRVLSTRATYTDAPLDRALGLLDETVRTARSLKDPELLGDALHALATCRYDNQFRVAKPDYGPTRRALQEAQALREKQQDPHRLAETIFYLGLVHERLDELKEAKTTYERALQIAAAAEDKLMMAYLYRHLADFQKPDRGLAGVLDYHQRSLRLREEVGFATGIVFASVAVAETLMDMKQPEQALPHYERALAVAQEIHVHRGAAYAHMGLAAVHHAAGHPDQAREHAREALAAAASSQDRDLIDAALQSAGRFLGPSSK